MSWDSFDLAAQLQKGNKKRKIVAKPTVFVAPAEDKMKKVV